MLLCVRKMNLELISGRDMNININASLAVLGTLVLALTCTQLF